MKKSILPALILIATASAAQAQGTPPEVQRQIEAPAVQQFRGIVIDARPTSIDIIEQDEGHQAVGVGGGALVGGLLGRAVGGKSHSTAGTVIGALAGGVAGGKLTEGQERVVGKTSGVEMTVRRDDGTLVRVKVPVANSDNAAPGDAVVVRRSSAGVQVFRDRAVSRMRSSSAQVEF